jgi:uncharacterized protein (TIGR03435 family)
MRIASYGAAILLVVISGGRGVAAQTVGAPSTAEATVASEGPQFEVATIKPSDPAACCGRTYSRQGRHFSTQNTYLRWLIQWAYGLQAKQVVGGPAWMDVDRYDISGEIDGTGAPTDREWKVAVQRLLADRFQLKFHHEIREMPAYALTVAKGGPKLTRTGPEDDQVPRFGFSGSVGQTMRGFGRYATLHDFMSEVQRLALDRPLVDRTGITGTFNMEIAFTREDTNSLGMTQIPDNAAPNLIDALQQQLGLKLEGVKAPVDVLVIDQAEPPSAN